MYCANPSPPTQIISGRLRRTGQQVCSPRPISCLPQSRHANQRQIIEVIKCASRFSWKFNTCPLILVSVFFYPADKCTFLWWYPEPWNLKGAVSMVPLLLNWLSYTYKRSFYHKSVDLYWLLPLLWIEITVCSNFQINGRKIMGFKCVKGTSFQYCNFSATN